MQRLRRLGRRLADGRPRDLATWAGRWAYWNLRLYRVRQFADRQAEIRREIREDNLTLSQLYEPRVRTIMERVIRPGWVCVDLGANIGQGALVMARVAGRHGKVYAFEAFPNNAVRLRRNLDRHGVGRRVTVINAAVADGTTDRLTIYAGRNSHYSEWNVVGHDVTGQPTAAIGQVRAFALDEYFDPGTRVHLVKVDVEGAEAMALAGMQRIIQENQPILIVEFHSEEGWAGREVLFDAGYTLFNIKGPQILPDSERVYQCVAYPTGHTPSEA